MGFIHRYICSVQLLDGSAKVGHIWWGKESPQNLLFELLDVSSKVGHILRGKERYPEQFNKIQKLVICFIFVRSKSHKGNLGQVH